MANDIVQKPPGKGVEKNPEKELNLKRNPLDDTKNPLKILLFLFMQDLIVLGTKRPLEMADMFSLPHHDLSAQTWKRVGKEFDREMKSITEEERKTYLNGTLFILLST